MPKRVPGSTSYVESSLSSRHEHRQDLVEYNQELCQSAKIGGHGSRCYVFVVWPWGELGVEQEVSPRRYEVPRKIGNSHLIIIYFRLNLTLRKYPKQDSSN